MLTRLTVVVFLKYTEISNHYIAQQELPQCSRSIILQKPMNKKTYRKREIRFVVPRDESRRNWTKAAERCKLPVMR